MHLNIQSIRNKINELEVIVDEAICDVILINEHWLRTEEVHLYVPRCFRLASAYCRAESYGGASILVRDYITFEKIDITHLTLTNFLEAACIYVKTFNVIFISLYRTPGSNFNIFYTYLESLLLFIFNKKPKGGIVLGADFNVDFLDTKNTETVMLINILKSFNLYQVNNSPTRQRRAIDNIVTNIDKNCYKSCLGKYRISDHEIVHFKFLISPAHIQIKNISFRKTNENRLNLFVHHLSQFDWYFLFKITDTDSAFEYFVNTLSAIYNYYCPRIEKVVKQQTQRKSDNSKWFNESLKRMRETVSILRDMLKIPVYKDNVALKNCYNLQRRLYRDKIKEAKIKFNSDIISNASNKCLAAWNIVKLESGNCFVKDNSHPPLTPDQFNDHYIKIGRDIVCQSIKNNGLDHNVFLVNAKKPPISFTWRRVKEDQISKIIKSLSTSKCEDIFGFSNNVMKLICNSIIRPLTYIINLSLSSSHFPNCLKVSKSIPLFKKGDRSCIDNYRTITFVSCFSKVLEASAKMQLLDFFGEYQILSNSQFGFRPGLSTVKALDIIVAKILTGFEANEFMGLTLLDLSKAFDSISHKILLNKLEFYGINKNQLKFFESYLYGRLHMVSVGGQRSSLREVLAGVPQGSILGPLLFILYVNDLPSNLNCNTILYADDTSVFVNDNCLNKVISNTNRAVDTAHCWFESNCLKINENKTEFIIFSLKRIKSENSTTKTVKLLGVTLDQKLIWEDHTNNVIAKLSRVCFLLRKLKSCVSNDLMKMAYFGFFHAHLLYANILWGNSVGAQRVFGWQKRAIRILFGLGYRDSCKSYFANYNIMTVPSIFIFQNLIYVRENIAQFITYDFIHNYQTRHAKDLVLPNIRLEKYAKSHKYVQIQLFNKLPETWRLLDLESYKKQISKFLTNNAFYSIKEFLSSEVDRY